MENVFGENLKRLRTQRCLSLRVVADAVGVSAPAVSRWEKGEARPRPQKFQALADFFDVLPSELLGTADVRRSDRTDQMKYEASPDGERSTDLATQTKLNDPEADHAHFSLGAIGRVIDEAKARIAALAGTSRERIKIIIEV